MKVTTLFISVLCCLFVGCGNTPGQNSGEPVRNNLSQSQGDNELDGKTFSNSQTRLSFSGDAVTESSATGASASIRAASPWKELRKFKYSWNSTATPKTLEFQLVQVWGSGMANGYEEQLEKAKTQVTAATTAVNQALASDTLYTTMGTAKDKVKGQVTAKAKTYTESQQSILQDYLKAKYESVIKFTYQLDSAQLTLTEQFKKDLSDASSKLTGTLSDVTFTLNDYDHLVPFKVEVSGKTYVGVPDITKTGSDSGTISVQLYPYYGSMMDGGAALATKISAAVTQALLDAAPTSLQQIQQELATGNTSKTLDGLLDDAIGQSLLEADYTLSSTGATLTLKTVPSVLTGLSSGNRVTLAHQPLLSTTLAVAQ